MLLLTLLTVEFVGGIDEATLPVGSMLFGVQSWNHDSRAHVSLVIVVMGTHSHAQDTSITLNHFAWTKFKSMQSTIAELLFLSGHLVNYNTVCHGNGTLIMDLMT